MWETFYIFGALLATAIDLFHERVLECNYCVFSFQRQKMGVVIA